jgi:aminopeptidase N
MVNLFRLSLVFILFSSCSSRKPVKEVVLTEGVDRQLAIYRKSVLSSVHYQLDLDIPAVRTQPIAAHEVLVFDLNATRVPLQVDFKEDPAKITSLILNGRKIGLNFQKEHLLLLPEFLVKGKNTLEVIFQAGEGALNRNTDYLYTLFVPDRARTVFPCFDQPDLKADYTLKLRIPADWDAVANAVLKDSVVDKGYKTYQYGTSDQLSTYLFAFAAGKFKRYSQPLGVKGKAAAFLYRETDQAKIKLSIPAIYQIHEGALKYYEDWTGIAYPFQQFGFVAIPDFQFGGMEHPGAIQYKASSLFLDGGATKDQVNARNNLIAHETAHMWFGDLVTMDWFSDVWMKEVFANFMADKSAASADGDSYALKFMIDHFPAAYAVDRTTGANPIRQPLSNLKDAGTLYGNIIYHKAPIMMQQLETLMGKEPFKQGVQEYLRKFSNGNASWPNLIQILDRYTSADLQRWNKVWVDESGRPLIDYSVAYKDGKISSLILVQKPEYGKGRTWPQTFEVTLFYPDASTKVLRTGFTTDQVILKEAIGLAQPAFILFNSAGEGYGQWPVDPALPQYLPRLTKPLHRASAYIALYEQMLTGKSITPAKLLQLLGTALRTEQEELNIKLISNYISSIYWQFSTPKQRQDLSADLEKQIWTAMLQHTGTNLKKQLFKAYQDVFLTPGGRDRLYQVWSRQQAPGGITLSEDDYTSLAFSLAVRDDADQKILDVQNSRISNADRKRRFEFIMPALSGDPAIRNQFFKSLQQSANRTKEANVLSALYYLHHPLRQSASISYLPQSLNMLQEIQTTGDIFFPQSWLQSTFGMYQSKAAAAVVTQFLSSNPGYNPKLKAKILQSADNLFRAAKLTGE